jgi:hypothetical protein
VPHPVDFFLSTGWETTEPAPAHVFVAFLAVIPAGNLLFIAD